MPILYFFFTLLVFSLGCLPVWATNNSPVLLRTYIIEGMVIDEDTGKPIANAAVVISNKTNKEVINLQSRANGTFDLLVEANKVYVLRASHKNFLAMEEVELQTFQHRKIYPLQLPLKQIYLSKALLVEKINFQVNDTSFTKNTYPALDKFYKVLKDNESLIVEIAVHTDSRGNDDYNLQLSQQRASYIVNYLITQGITATRLRGVGYGESRLVNGCANGIRCGGADHEANRRVEFVVMDFSQ